MIVKRNRKPAQPPRMIVRRSPETVGDRRPRTIVKRSRPGVVMAPAMEDARRAPSLRVPRRWLWGPIAVVTLVALGYGGWWLWESPALRVNHVRVSGNQRTSTDEILRATGLLGQSMFTADLADAQEVLYSFPLIASLEVQRDWPNTVRVNVVERSPWGTWEQDGVRYTVDRDGVVLGSEPPPPGSPRIKTADRGALRIGDHVNYQAVDAAAEIYERLPRQLGTTVTEIAYVTGSGVQVTTANGQQALLGDSSSIAYKLAVWAALSTEARNQGVSYTTIDLRYGNRPVLY
jgi:cell division protein FtsQ